MRRLLSICLVSLLGGLTSPTTFAAAKAVDANALILLDLAADGDRLIAVGEAGAVLRSADQGHSWQLTQTPTTRTLTSVALVDAKTFVAVGHGGTLLRSADGGGSWAVIELPDGNTDSLLGVTRLRSGSLIA